VWRLRRIQFTLLAVVVAVVGGLLWSHFSGPSSKDCGPVRELLSFNKAQTDLLNSKTHVPEKGSFEQETQPSDLDYQNWSDGLADRAAKVTAPELAGAAKELADSARRMTGAMIEFNAQAKATAPGAQPPPVGMVAQAFYNEFQGYVQQLSKACS
jgi:hypothetical protein